MNQYIIFYKEIISILEHTIKESDKEEQNKYKQNWKSGMQKCLTAVTMLSKAKNMKTLSEEYKKIEHSLDELIIADKGRKQGEYEPEKYYAYNNGIYESKSIIHQKYTEYRKALQ